ncbi:MAG: tRNA (adenosine(37)-N6)-threonylcarbamoyltransferase complex dimerization subunit type 1 TsaB [Candidatus Binatia bacterium]|nr:tRNA (adenosine(37)-N6)-threonylcarbamoyltransferase complex dimerization subunit type 1 TsaB [Candidatus Binatia bacterium]
MILLGIDTATSTGGVGIVRAGDGESRILADDSRVAGRTHGAMILEQMDAALATAELELSEVDVFAVANGPGSFTGLRVGMATAKSLAWACGRPLIGVPTLEAWAGRAISIDDTAAAGADQVIGVVLDARKGEVYRAAFASDPGASQLRRILPEAVVAPEACADSLLSLVGAGSTVRLLGDGPARYTEAFSSLASLKQVPMDTLPPSGGAVASLAASRALAGDFDDPRRLAPLYVRASEAELSLAKR